MFVLNYLLENMFLQVIERVNDLLARLMRIVIVNCCEFEISNLQSRFYIERNNCNDFIKRSISERLPRFSLML